MKDNDAKVMNMMENYMKIVGEDCGDYENCAEMWKIMNMIVQSQS